MNIENSELRDSALWRRKGWLSDQRILVICLIAAGLLLRLYHYGRNPSMWHDEAATVINVLHKSFGGLLGPLEVSATGPPLFLWVQKCVTLCVGDGTYALRLVSFLASCAGLVLFARFARRELAPIPAACGTLLVACSDRLLWHAAEARHYSTDFLIAAGLLALLAATRMWPLSRRACFFALLASPVIFASYPGVFLLGGVLAALLPELRHEARVKTWLACGLFGIVTAGAFATFYFVIVCAQRSAAMDAAWVQTFPHWDRPWTVPLWALTSTVSVVDYMCRPIGGILIVPAIVGAVRFWRGERRELVLFALTPMLLAMIAALPKCYPYTGARTMVFAMPGLVLLIAAGIGHILEWVGSRRARGMLAVAAVTLPLAATLGWSLYRTAVPWPRADTSGASAYVLVHRQPNEPVTANHWEYIYYFRSLGAAFSPDLRLLNAGESPERLWVVMTAADPRDRQSVLGRLSKWQLIEQREFMRTTVFLLSRKEP